MPMLRSLNTLESQTEDPAITAATIGLRQDVEAGSSVGEAMERHPEVFDQLYRSMVRAGESSGQLEQALDMVAFQIEKLDALRRQVRSAMMYPALIFGFALVVVIIVVAFIVPVFVGLFEELASENEDVSSALPLPTQIVVSASDLMTGSWFIVAPVVIGLVVAFRKWKKTDKGAYAWDVVQAEAADEDRRRGPEGRNRPLVAHLRRNDHGRCPDPSGRQDRR